MQQLKEIKSITFGVYSKKQIENTSVCCITNTKKSGPGSVYDPKMGPCITSLLCSTCNENAIVCTGHPGHIELSEPIIHPLFYRITMSFLNCVCFKCYRVMITKDQININGLKTFSQIVDKIKKMNICCQAGCSAEKPSLKFSITDNTIHMVHDRDKTMNITMTTHEILNILDNISDDDVRVLGFDPSLSHPRNYIIQSLPVLPPVDRPYVQVSGNIWDDDLTVQYMEIIKANETLKKLTADNVSEMNPMRLKTLNSLIFRISTTFNNNQNKAKHTTNSRPIKGVKERLSGKDGQIRSNMMGKRSNHTARTVIGPDPTLKSGEIAIPREMADVLTIPERVTSYNIDRLQWLVNNGHIDVLHKNDSRKSCINIKRFRLGTRLIHNDVIYRLDKQIHIDGRDMLEIKAGDRIKRAGKFLNTVIETNRDYKLLVGMTVHRHLRDGDTVLLNRQPTLHKGSILAMTIKIRPFKTVRMNLSVCKSFNADFDGDEMNIHVPQGLEAQTELDYLSKAKYNIISPQSSKPGLAIVQDSLLGAYRMTQGFTTITKGQFFDISMVCNIEGGDIIRRIQEIRRVLKDKGKPVKCFTGKGLISLFLPKDLNYEFTNNAIATEPTVKIYKGVLYEGVFDKNILGSSHSSLIHLINKEYGPDASMNFIDCIQFCTNKWLMIHGFSVGLGDCLLTDKSKEIDIQDNIKKCYIEADGIKSTTTHEAVREIRINGSLNKAKDIGLKIAKNSLDSSNNFLSTVNSGSKGDFFNISQITGLLGQQNLKGRRVQYVMNNGKRSLPHYPMSGLTSDLEYESRGFISSSFINGLNPKEFFFHAMSGREGITDTAMGTATSGYMQRRIVKLTEDIKVQYDGSVRDTSGKIYQHAYGGTGIDPTMTIKVNGKHEACDIARLADKLNMNHEIDLRRRK